MDTIKKFELEAEKCFEIAKNSKIDKDRSLNLKKALKLKSMQKEFEHQNNECSHELKRYEETCLDVEVYKCLTCGCKVFEE
ncbi:hypothetical protein D4A35_08360 [Paraclostridium bifermentans]|uniref:Uncharacterized protein n=1 Tax=Paraclostridium bifermentans TaxID=1490 RepID=A0A5P3XF39_PARBF|nr:hypothetical protein [Paraclostridium bifermentans]QEZ68945.1 hypothetical protein D4A35_08360 [Paraclostridium bifermentans]